MGMYSLIEDAVNARLAELKAQGLSEDEAAEIVAEERDREHDKARAH